MKLDSTSPSIIARIGVVVESMTVTILASVAADGSHHAERLDAICPGHGGESFARTGGIALAAFRSVPAAIRCAVELHDAHPSARSGLQVGEADASSLARAPAAAEAVRLTGLTQPGEILVTALVRELAAQDASLRFEEAHAGEVGLSRVVLRRPTGAPLRVVIADDHAIVRDGVAALLRESGIEVLGAVGDAARLHEAVARSRPDVAIIDIRMPPTFTDEGLVAAETIRAAYPQTGVLVLSQHLDVRYALRLAGTSPTHSGYLLKERITDSRVLLDAVGRVAAGGCVIDSSLAEQLVSSNSAPLRSLTARERDVLALVASGRSNGAIARELVVSPKTVEAHIRQIFQKLNLAEAPDEDRRVRAVLIYLHAGSPA
jgi:DNA-binding NarL/FixJ family response regulator